ncbi:MAG: protein-methionine-sulfoxide reductase catalytic subunit MsrP [Rhodospirillaceae bacterium]|nr:protein-methionine-sulfoxide reductase catalytic subunit MsrP [Rhodospirillaceae bacterium]|tara:strand:- start:627 stop:1589 length:963 start_codon:yes stop_codon:yes gene_type:complete
MLIRSKRGWELPESDATDERIFHSRRNLIKGLASGAVLAASMPVFGKTTENENLNYSFSVPVKNNRYKLDRELTPHKLATTYNNFYEFGSHKQISADAQKLKTHPWMITIDGLVEEKIKINAHELFKHFNFEERVYRFRCVEAWSMALPWIGFPLAELVKMAKPTSDAKYLVMRSFQDPKIASGQRQFWYPWPYLEALTVAEAKNELAFIATGVYGKPIPNQMGAPLRLVVPWKYGFKSIKSIISFTFTKIRPKTFWETIQPAEYGFWANVNPLVSHPRWSQKTERPLGKTTRIKTLLYNGYEEYVAYMYKNLVTENLFR